MQTRICWLMLVSCGCQSQTAPRPAESKRMSTPSTRGQPFTLTYTSTGGPEFGPRLYERQTSLTIHSGDRTVLLEQHRSESDEAGAPIGIFRWTADPESLQKLIEYAVKERLEDLAPPTRGGPGTSVMTIALELDGRKISKTLTSADIPQIGQLEYFLYQLNQIMFAARQAPYQAVRVTVARDLPAHRFVVGIENIGKANVCLFDPRAIGSGDPNRWIGVRLAELPQEIPGVTSPPLEWSEIHVQQEAGPPRVLTLKAGERLAVPSASWSNPRQGVKYLVQGVWSDYATSSGSVDCYFMRGAAFSENLTVAP